MRFQCAVASLQETVATVIRALNVRPESPALECVLIETTPSGIRMFCTDLSIGIESSLPATVIQEGSVILPGKLFADIVRKLPADIVHFHSADDQRTTIRCGGSRTVMKGFPSNIYPQLPQIPENITISIPQKRLRSMIQKTIFSIAADETRPILTGALLEIEPTGLTMVALDGFRLAISRTHLQTNQNEAHAVIPGKALAELLHIIEDKDDVIDLSLNDKYAAFTLASTQFITRLLEGEFMRYRQILPTEHTTRAVVPKHAFADSIARASLIALEGKNNLVRIQIEKDILTLTSNSDNNQIEEIIQPVEIDGKSLEIAFNVKYLTDINRVIEDDTYQMLFQTPISPCVFKPIEGDAFLFLVLPVRVVPVLT